MQILRFEDAPEVAPKRKKSSAGWIGLGLVAALFGVSTAFAGSTIRINNDQDITLAQGVITLTAGCDDDIKLSIDTSLRADFKSFYASNLNLTKINAACDGSTFELQLYNSLDPDNPTTPLTCTQLLTNNKPETPVPPTDAGKARFTNCVGAKVSGVFSKVTGDGDNGNLVIALPVFSAKLDGGEFVLNIANFDVVTLQTIDA